MDKQGSRPTPMMDHVKRLTIGAGKRTSASPSEERAARLVEERLLGAGLECRREKFRSRSNDVAPRVLCHAALFLTVLFYRSSPLVFYFVFVSFMVLLLLEYLGRSPIGSLQWRHHSGNVVAVIKPFNDASRKVVIMASLDVPRFPPDPSGESGARRRFMAILLVLLNLVLGIWLTLLTGANVLSVSQDLLFLFWKIALVASLPNVAAALLVGASYFKKRQCSENDAAALAALISIGERFSRRRLSGTELWLVATGSDSPVGIGTKRFLSKHRKELKGASFIYLHSLGRDQPVVYRKVGLVMPLRANRSMIGVAERVNNSYPHYRLLVERNLPLLGGAFRLASTGKRVLLLGSRYDKTRPKEERKRDRVIPISLRENVNLVLHLLEFADKRGWEKKG
jgi:hypothetical protein